MTRHTNALTGEIIDLARCEDGEVLGLDASGLVLQWHPEDGLYNSGETLAEYGTHNLRAHECPRVGLCPATPATVASATGQIRA